MKILYWDDIDPETGEVYRMDHPNLRWGDPSYVLERGDYGWQPTVFSEPKPKTKPMTHQTFYPMRVGDQIVWLTNFYHKLPLWAATLGVTAAQQAEIIADVRWLIYVLQDWLPAVRAFNQACTAAARGVETGSGGSVALPVFTAPSLPGSEGSLPVLTPRPEGVLRRLFDVIQEWKQINACTDTLCQDLRIIGSEESAPDLATVQPALTARRSGSQVEIGWNWQGLSRWLESCEIQVDRGAGWELLLMDTKPNCTDVHAQPAPQTIWKYRAIFRVDESRVGQWSETVSVIVGA